MSYELGGTTLNPVPEPCETCKQLRSGLSWVGDPPCCPEHQKTIASTWR